MSDPPQAPLLVLPSAALNAPLPGPHADSEEAVQFERHRTAQELNTIHESGAPPSALHSPTMRSRGVRNSPCSGELGRGLGRRTSEISTVPDSLGPGEHGGRRYRLKRQVLHWYDPVVNFWTMQVSVTIDDGAHRDHLGKALERTFLAYLRTSLALAVTGVIIAQLFRLQHTSQPSPDIGFFVLGVPLAAAFIGFGMLVLLIGAFRFWRQQNAMIRGKVYAGGWELTCTMVSSMLIVTATFVLVTAIDVTKSYESNPYNSS